MKKIKVYVVSIPEQYDVESSLELYFSSLKQAIACMREYEEQESQCQRGFIHDTGRKATLLRALSNQCTLLNAVVVAENQVEKIYNEDTGEDEYKNKLVIYK